MDQPLTEDHPSRGAVLVTGGSGYIGRPLVAALAATGHRVVNLDRSPGPAGWIAGDVRAIPHGLPPATTVVHLAGLAGGGGPADAELAATNVAGTRAVLDHARRTGARHVVLVSSIAVLGPCELPVDETAEISPDSAYARSKATAERLAQDVQDLRVSIVRPGYVFGADHPGNFGRMVSSIRAGRFALPGRADTIKAGIYLPDLVSLLRWLVEHPDPPPLVHAVHPDTPTVLAWARMVQQRVAPDRPVRIVPGPVVTAGLAALDGLVAVTGSRRLARLPTTVRKLRRSSNVVSTVLPAAGFSFAHRWDTALDDLFGPAGPTIRPAGRSSP